MAQHKQHQHRSHQPNAQAQAWEVDEETWGKRYVAGHAQEQESHFWGQVGFTNWGVRRFICGGDRAQGG